MNEILKEKDSYLSRRREELESNFSDVQIEIIMYRIKESWEIAQHKTTEVIRKEEYNLRQELLK